MHRMSYYHDCTDAVKCNCRENKRGHKRVHTSAQCGCGRRCSRSARLDAQKIINYALETSSVAKCIYTILIVLLSSSSCCGGLGAAIRERRDWCESLIKACATRSLFTSCSRSSWCCVAVCLMKSDVIRWFKFMRAQPPFPYWWKGQSLANRGSA